MKTILRLVTVALTFASLLPRSAEAGNTSSTPEIDVLLQGERKPGEIVPAFVIDDPTHNRMAMVVGRFRRGVLTGPHHVILLDRENPEHSLSVFYTPGGEPLQVKFATGWRLDFKLLKSAGTLRATLRDPAGNKALIENAFADLLLSGSASPFFPTRTTRSAAEPPFQSPYRLRWAGFHIDKKEIADGLAGSVTVADDTGAIAGTQSFLLTNADRLFTRFQKLAVASGNAGAQAWVVAHGWISDFLTFADEETHSTSVHVIKTSYDFSRNVKAIDKFIKAPSPDTLAFASNALEDISVTAENGIALGSAQVDGSGNVTDVVVENPPPDPDLTDPQIKAAIDATAAVVADALGSIDKPYTFTNVTAGVIGTLPLKMQRKEQYFTTMTKLVGNCEMAATLLGEMDPGTLRDSAEGKVIGAKSAVFDELNDAFNNLITQRSDFQTQAATFQTQADGALAAANDPNGSAEYRRGAQQLYDASIILRDVLLANAELCLQLARDVSQLTQRTNAIIIP